MPVKKDPSKRSKDGTGYYIETARKTGNRNKAVYDSQGIHAYAQPGRSVFIVCDHIDRQRDHIADGKHQLPHMRLLRFDL